MRRQTDQFLDGTLGAAGCVRLDNDGDKKEERNDPRRLEIAAGKGGQNRQRYQLVHIDPPLDQILDGRQNDGESQTDGAKRRTEAGGEPEIRENPFQQE